MKDLYLRNAGFKAWVVKDTEEGYACVVWARNPLEAKRLGLYELDDNWWYGEGERYRIERAKQFDNATKETLKELQWKNGWWFECESCGNERITNEGGIFIKETQTVYCGLCVYG